MSRSSLFNPIVRVGVGGYKGSWDGETVDGVEVEGIATIDRAFMIPGGSHRSPETYIECGDMVSLDAEMSARAFNAVIAADNVRESLLP